MKKIAITYYYQMGNGYSDVVFHESGKKALEHFKQNYKRFFPKVLFKNQLPKTYLTKGFKVGFGHRFYGVSFLENHPDLIPLYEQQKGVLYEKH